MATTTYSFKDLAGTINSPLAGPFVIAGGSLGTGSIALTMQTTRSEQDTAADGSVMVSAIAGSGATISIECQQTSAIHKFLLGMNNLHQTAVNLGDVSNWAASTIQLRNLVDTSQHLATGVSISKTPDKTYAARGGMVRWELLAANLVNL